MIPAVLITLSLLIAIFLIAGSPRINIPRKAGFEGLDDLEAASAYDLVSRMPPFIFLRRLVASKLARRRPAGVLADIGCGPGYLANLIAARFSDLSVIGVDTSDEMVRTAKANSANKGLTDRVNFRQGDVARLPFDDHTLDFALSTLSLHHWSNPEMALREIHRVLKPAGAVLIFDLRRDARRRYLWLMRFVTSVVAPAGLRRIQEPLGSLLSSYTVSEVQELLRNSPFAEWTVEGGGVWMFIWICKAS